MWRFARAAHSEVAHADNRQVETLAWQPSLVECDIAQAYNPIVRIYVIEQFHCMLMNISLSMQREDTIFLFALQ